MREGRLDNRLSLPPRISLVIPRFLVDFTFPLRPLRSGAMRIERFFLGMLFLSCWFFCNNLSARPIKADEPTAENATMDPNPPHYALVLQLGASRFADREAAAIALIEVGPEALPALAQASELNDPEIRARAQLIHRQVEESWFNSRAEKFVSGAPLDEPFTGWDQALPILGNTHAARTLFVLLSRRYPEFVKKLSAPPQERAHAAEEVADASRKRQFRGEAPELPDLLPILLVANDREVTLPPNVHRRIAELTTQSFFTEAMIDTHGSAPLLKMINHWILNAPENSAIDALHLAVTRNWSAGAERARRMLNQEKISSDDFIYVMFVMSRMGTPEDIAILRKYFEDRREVYRGAAEFAEIAQTPDAKPDPNKLQLRVTQIRDVAYATSCILLRINPKEVGFPFAQPQSRWFVDPGSLDQFSFPGDLEEPRQAVFAEIEKRIPRR